MYSFFYKLIFYSFLILFLNKALEFLNFLTGLVLVSYKAVSYKAVSYKAVSYKPVCLYHLYYQPDATHHALSI